MRECLTLSLAQPWEIICLPVCLPACLPDRARVSLPESLKDVSGGDAISTRG